MTNRLPALKTPALTITKAMWVLIVIAVSMVTLSFMVGVGMLVVELTGNLVLGMTSTAFTATLICFIASMIDRSLLRSQA